MSGTTKINCHPERDICEQFGCLPKLVVYTNSLDVNELSEIPNPHHQGGYHERQKEFELRRDRLAYLH